MESRRADIHVPSDHFELSRAVIIALSSAITSFSVKDEDYEPWLELFQVYVDDQYKDFTVAHVITTGTRVSGVILMHTVVREEDDSILDFVVISYHPKHGFDAFQEVMSVTQEVWLRDQAKVLHELANYLFIS